jgi:hypothetical protein
MKRRGGFVPLGLEDPARSNMSSAWAPVDRSCTDAPQLRSVGKEVCEPQGVGRHRTLRLFSVRPRRKTETRSDDIRAPASEPAYEMRERDGSSKPNGTKPPLRFTRTLSGRLHHPREKCLRARAAATIWRCPTRSKGPSVANSSHTRGRSLGPAHPTNRPPIPYLIANRRSSISSFACSRVSSTAMRSSRSRENDAIFSTVMDRSCMRPVCPTTR